MSLPRSEMSYGQLAYEAYGEFVGWSTFNGDPMPTWEAQSEKLRDAWTAAANAVVDEVG